MANDDDGGLPAGGGNRSLEELWTARENLRNRESRSPVWCGGRVSQVGARDPRGARRRENPAPPEFSESNDGGILHQRHVAADSGTDEETEHLILGEPRFAAQPRYLHHNPPTSSSSSPYTHQTSSPHTDLPYIHRIGHHTRETLKTPNHTFEITKIDSGFSPSIQFCDHQNAINPICETQSTETHHLSQFHDHKNHQLVFVLQKLLLSPSQENDSQRHNIFRTRCTINGKVCDLVIDHGSSENVISKAAVNALGLPVEKHPNPYKVGWIKSGVEARVTEICKVSFSIGKLYRDEKWCDIIDMDACQILLGRPWLFDVDATYKGRMNCYMFIWKGKKIVLMPLQAQQPTPPVSEVTEIEGEDEPSSPVKLVVKTDCGELIGVENGGLSDSEVTVLVKDTVNEDDGNAVAVIQGAQFESSVEANENVLEVVNDTSKCHLVKDARRVFDEVVCRDLVLWNVMVSCDVLNCLADKAFEVFNLMRFGGVKGDEFTFPNLLNACGTFESFKYGKQIHGLVIKQSFDIDVLVASALVDTYTKNGYIENARKAFDQMTAKNVITWAAMVSGYIHNGMVDEARRTFDAMPEKNTGSWNTMITGYTQSEEITLARNLCDRSPLDTIACDSVRFAEPVNDKIVLSVLIGQIVSTLGFGFENVKTKGVRRRQWQIAWLFSACRWAIVLVPLWLWDTLRRDFSVGVYHSHKPNMGTSLHCRPTSSFPACLNRTRGRVLFEERATDVGNIYC